MNIFAADDMLSAENSAELIYPNDIPGFAEHSLDQLYGSLYASLPQLRCSKLAGVSTYAGWRDHQLSTLLLYCVDGSRIRVINEGLHIPPPELTRFASTLFEQYGQVSVIELHALSVNPVRPDHHSVSLPVTEDIVIDLPDTEEAYVARLGKSSRKSLRQHLSRAQRDFPGFRHCVMAGDTISEDVIDQIIGFNRTRMIRKQRNPGIDARSRAHLHALVRSRGWVGVVRTDAHICAGTIACRFGRDVFSLVNAHDPRYDSYGMGNLSRHLLITASIRAGLRRFHLLGGQWSTKRHALAHRHRLHEVRLYRSRLAQIRDAPGLLQLLRRSASYLMLAQIEDWRLQANPGIAVRLMLRLQRVLRAARRHLRQAEVSDA